MLEAAIFVIFPLCMAIAAFSDMLTMTIPNRVSVILAGSFLLLVPFMGFEMTEILWHLSAGVSVFAVCFLLFALNVMGGGDVKVLSAGALWYGFNQSLFVFLGLVGILGGLLALIVLVIRANQNTLLVSPVPIPMHFFKSSSGIPYGIAIGIAAFLTYPDTEIVQIAIANLR